MTKINSEHSVDSVENPAFVPRDHGFLFKDSMVLAFLEERKTQTRRDVAAHNSTVLGYNPRSKTGAVLWKQLYWNDKQYPVRVDHGPHILHPEASQYLHVAARCHGEKLVYRVRCNAVIGDRIYAKEVYCPPPLGESIAYYRASHDSHRAPTCAGWKSSMMMPKKFARLWFEIVGIRAGRVQDISEEDAISEGVGAGFRMNAGWPDYLHINKIGHCELTQDTARMSYSTLRDVIHGAGSWVRNDWVWIYDLKRISIPSS